MSHSALIGTLVSKDARLYFSNQFFALITVLGLVAYVAIFYLLPSTVDETLEMALFAPDVPADFVEEMSEDGLEIRLVDSEAALRQAVESGDFPVGLALPENLAGRTSRGELPEMRVYLTPDVPAEFQDIYTLMGREFAFMLTGSPLYLEATEEVLGVDMAGQQIPPRSRMLPMLAVFVLMLETLGLASLITMEIESGTMRALLITPVSVLDLFLSKGLFGVGLAFSQIVLLMLLTGGLRNEPLLMLVTLLLGAILVTGIGFLVASMAGDMMSVLAWGMLAIVVLAIPALVLFLPGITSGWIQLIPSYYLVDTVHLVINFGAGWADVWTNLVILGLFGLLFGALGIVMLRRRMV